MNANLRLVQICIFSALIAALGLLPRIDIPVAAGVPITAQTLGVMLAGLVLGARAGALSVLLFLAMVALGMPFLAGGRGGLGVFAGPTTGFLLGWIPGAFVTGLIAHGWQHRGTALGLFRGILAAICGGIVVVYVCGVSWLMLSGMTFKSAFIASAIFLPGDLIKSILASWIASRFALYGKPGRNA